MTVAGGSSEYLVSSQQGSASVHVILRLKDVNHLVRVKLEHALHLLFFKGFLATLARLFVQLLSALLVLPDPPQIPGETERRQTRLLNESLMYRTNISEFNRRTRVGFSQE